MLLAGSAVVGMVLMNSPLSDGVQRLLAVPFQVGVGDWVLSKPIELWINDFLMAIFFLLVGVEIKHEWGHGALATPQARVLPLGAAVGGMAVPALIYLAINWGQPPNLAGWAIPAATILGLASPLRYFRNTGTGKFAEETQAAGLAGLTGGLNLVSGDYDNDGRVDVLVLRGGWMGAAGPIPAPCSATWAGAASRT